MTLTLEVQRVEPFLDTPSDGQLNQWADSVGQWFNISGEVVLRVVDEKEMQQLNHQYRHQDKVTNVLSFGVDEFTRQTHGLLGDLVICAPQVQKEASLHNKSLEAHWAHLLIHGVLHLLGYDHQSDQQANEMEGYEIQLLKDCGYRNPYLISST